MNILISLALIALALAPFQLPDSLLEHLQGPLPTAKSQETGPVYKPVPIPVRSGITEPQLDAPSWYAVDLTSNQTLAAHKADQRQPIASVTKMVTALVVFRTHKETDIITVPKLPTYGPEDSIIGLKEGEQFTVRDLLAALLIQSANDAADTFAIADSGSIPAFATKMDKLVAEWGIDNADFSNPSGLNDVDNGASAVALAKIGQLGLQNDTFRTFIATPTATIHSRTGTPYVLHTTDQLLQSGRFQGIKTGYTQAAGGCFVGLTTIQGHQVITVVLGSQDRFGDTIKLADWINQNYRWQ